MRHATEAEVERIPITAIEQTRNFITLDGSPISTRVGKILSERPAYMKSRSFTRFTFRKLMLLVVAIGAIVALFVTLRPSRPSTFIVSFTPEYVEKVLLSECKTLSITPINWHSDSGSSTFSPRYSRHLIRMHLSVPSTYATSIFAQFQTRTESCLRETGCAICGLHEYGELSFGYDYVSAKREGSVFAFGFVVDEGVSIVTVVDENRL